MWTRKRLKNVFVEPLLENLVLALTVFGAVFIFVGSAFGLTIDSWQFSPPGTSDSLTKIGGAMLGGGVFAAIMKGKQFNSIFLDNISAVHYDPKAVLPYETVRGRWETLTGSILKSTLPQTYKAAASEIANQFFGDELKYHFEGLEIRYDLELQDDRESLIVKQTMVSKIVISPNQDSVILRQKFKANGEFSLKNLLVNGRPVRLQDHLVQDPNDPTEYEFALNLLDFRLKENEAGDSYLQLQRTYEYSHSIVEDPNIILDLVRYVKELTVKVRLAGPGKFTFKETGTKMFTSPAPFVCPEGWTWYRMADDDQLLLPGQGYIITVIRN